MYILTKFISILNKLELIIKKYSLTEQVSNLKEILESIEIASDKNVENLWSTTPGIIWNIYRVFVIKSSR